MSTVNQRASRNTFYEHLDGYMVGVTANGLEFYFDIADYELVSKYTWYITHKGYVASRHPYLLLHRLLYGNCKDMQVDHRDGVKINNRRDNLRSATNTQNHYNKGKHTGNCSSQYKGVYYESSRNKYVARITVNGKTIGLGRFDSDRDAAVAYNNAAIKYHGEFARLNEVI